MNSLTVENDVVDALNEMPINYETSGLDEVENSSSNEDTTNIEDKASASTTIEVRENNSVEVSYLVSDNSDLSNKNKINTSFAVLDALSYSEIRNNCYEEEYVSQSMMLKMLKKNQMFIWMTSTGEYCYKMGYNGTVNEITEPKLKKILKNKLKIPVTIDSQDPAMKDKNIDTCHLRLISKETFNPHEDKEFFEKDGETYRNLFVKTKYLLLDECSGYNEPTTIISLIKNLVNNDEERYVYFMNWLASFIQTMERTPIAIIIKGKQGTGKNLFIDEVLKHIFGSTQVAVIGDKEIKKQFTASLFDNKLLLVLDELANSYKDNYQMQNFLKQIIGSNYVFMEKKHQNTKDEIRLWGPVLIFSNKSVPIAIETNSRREVVFKSGKPLTEINFLECGSYENLCKKIHDELNDFTLTLFNWKVDKNMASIAMDTPEKDALANMTHDRIALFNDAITSGDINYFEEMKEDVSGISLYNELKENFNQHKVKKNNLAQIYNALFEERISTKTLMNMLKTYDAEFYDVSNTIGDGSGGKYFLLEDHPKKGIKNSDYVNDVVVEKTVNINFPPLPLFSPLSPTIG